MSPQDETDPSDEGWCFAHGGLDAAGDALVC